MQIFNNWSYIQKCIIDIKQCSVTNKQSSITVQQCFYIKKTYIGFNKLHLLSTKYFEIQQFCGYKINNLQTLNNLQNEKTIVTIFQHFLKVV